MTKDQGPDSAWVWRMSGPMRSGTTGLVLRNKILRRKGRSRGKFIFSFQMTTSRIGNHTPVDAQSATCDGHNTYIHTYLPTYIHTYIHTSDTSVSKMSTVPMVSVGKERRTTNGPGTQSLDLINSVMTRRRLTVYMIAVAESGSNPVSKHQIDDTA